MEEAKLVEVDVDDEIEAIKLETELVDVLLGFALEIALEPEDVVDILGLVEERGTDAVEVEAFVKLDDEDEIEETVLESVAELDVRLDAKIEVEVVAEEKVSVEEVPRLLVDDIEVVDKVLESVKVLDELVDV